MLNRVPLAITICAATLVVSIFTAPAGAQDNVSAEKRIERVEKQLRAVQRKVFGDQGSVESSTEATISRPPVQSDNSSRKLVADMSVKISAIERQMREITGRLEAIEYAQEQMAKKLDLLTKDTSIRFEEMRTSVAEPVSPEASKTDKVEIIEAPELTLPTGSPDSQFQWAFGFVAKNDLKNGLKALNLFLEEHPDGDLSANAHFWLGRVYIQNKEFGLAAKHFLTVFEENPGHKKAPEALVNLGDSLIQFNQNDGACEAYLEFRRAYPDAKARLISKVDAGEKRAKC